MIFIALILSGQDLLKMLLGLLGGANRESLLSIPVVSIFGLVILLLLTKVTAEITQKGFSNEGKALLNLREFMRLQAVFGILMIASLLWTTNVSYGLNKSIVFYVMNLGLAIAILHQVRTYPLLKLFLLAIFIFSCFQAFHAVLLQFRFAIPGELHLYSYMDNQDGDLDPAVEYGIALGRRAGLGLITGFALFMIIRKKSYRFFVFLGILSLIAVVILSSSRGAYLGTAIGMMVFLIFSRQGRSKGGLFLILSSALVLYFFLNFVGGLVEYRMNSEVIGSAGEFRMKMVAHAFSVFFDNPLLGIGLGAWGEAYFGLGVNMFPHNIFGEIAAELGVVGLLIFVLFLSRTIRKTLILFRQQQENREARFILAWAAAFFCAAMVYAQFSGHIGRNEWVWVSSAVIFQLWNLMIKNNRSDILPVGHRNGYRLGT